MFEAIGLAVLSDLGRRYTPPGRWIHLPFRGATMVVAPGRMIDSFLSIPDAESLPLYSMVLKLACVCVYLVCIVRIS
jgi:hypothetical protein